jgi:LPXTG-motif cell wall-anchored protein
MPYLLDNKLLAVEQKDAVEKKLSEWKSIVSPQDYTWLYAVVGLGLIFIIALIFILKKKKTPTDTASA